ncbi:MAG: ribonuclease HIII [bacterium]
MELIPLYEELKETLSKNGFQVNPFREIQYGLQFIIFKKDQSILIRLYKSKKGLKLDLSQAEHPHLKTLFLKSCQAIIKKYNINNNQPKKESSTSPAPIEKEPEELIGIDESGKGDYFGPLVTAGVYVSKKNAEILRTIGVKDSKTLEDSQILQLAPQIKATCPYSLILMSNYSYNELYEKMKNLNHLLSWAHAKAIQNVLDQEKATAALSDKFAPKTLIQAALFNQGIRIELYERHKAESHIAVAAASILARASYVEQLNKLSKFYKQTFPKGCSPKTLAVAKHFYEKYGKEELACVAKLHFNVTEKLLKEH